MLFTGSYQSCHTSKLSERVVTTYQGRYAEMQPTSPSTIDCFKAGCCHMVTDLQLYADDIYMKVVERLQ